MRSKSRCVTDCAFVLKKIQCADCHLSTRCRTIVIEQLRQGLEQNIQVGLSESRVLGEERRNKLMRAVQAVGNGVFSAHLAARGLFVAFFGLDPVCIPGIGERNARDRMLHTEHRRL
jgi:hypothetical protein